MASPFLTVSAIVLGIGCLSMPPRPGGDAGIPSGDGSGSAPGSVLDVVVTDRAGAPLADATIWLMQDAVEVGAPVPDATLAAGHYRFAGIPAELTTIHVSHAGLVFPVPAVTVSPDGIAETLVRAVD